jgi:SOS response associated peptidase (SRAP)
MARWGLIPFWMKEKPKVPHINARAETVHKLPLFREAFSKRRCLIPATGFYEWQQRSDGKQPYRFRSAKRGRPTTSLPEAHSAGVPWLFPVLQERGGPDPRSVSSPKNNLTETVLEPN